MNIKEIYNTAERHYDSGDYINAEKQYTSIIESTNGESDAYYYRAKARIELNKIESALKDLNISLSLNPHNYKALANRGEIKKDFFNDNIGAIEDYNLAIGEDSAIFSLYNNRGNIKMNLHDYTGALNDFTEAIRLDPQNGLPYFNRGIIKSRVLKQYSSAIEDYSLSIKIIPNFFNAYVERAETYFFLNLYESAISDCDTALNINSPDNDIIFSIRGDSLCFLKRFDEAIQDFDKGITLNPNAHYLFLHRGNAKLEIHDFMDALNDFNEAIKIKPNRFHAFVGRAQAYLNLELYKKSLIDCDRAIAIEPNSEFAYATKGKAYSCLGDYEKALEFIKKAILINKDNINSMVLFGDLFYEHLNNPEAAICAYRIAKNKDLNKSHSLDWKIGLAYLAWKEVRVMPLSLQSFWEEVSQESIESYINKEAFSTRLIIAEQYLAIAFINQMNHMRTDLNIDWDNYRFLWFQGNYENILETLQKQSIWFSNPLIFSNTDIYEFGLVRKASELTNIDKIMYENTVVRCLTIIDREGNIGNLDTLWEDYANGYKGLAIELSFSKDWLIKNNIYSNKVKYTDIVKDSKINSDSPEQVIIDGLCSKKMKNINENEFRLIKFGLFDKTKKGLSLPLGESCGISIVKIFLGSNWDGSLDEQHRSLKHNIVNIIQKNRIPYEKMF